MLRKWTPLQSPRKPATATALNVLESQLDSGSWRFRPHSPARSRMRWVEVSRAIGTTGSMNEGRMPPKLYVGYAAQDAVTCRPSRLTGARTSWTWTHANWYGMAWRAWVSEDSRTGDCGGPLDSRAASRYNCHCVMSRAPSVALSLKHEPVSSSATKSVLARDRVPGT